MVYRVKHRKTGMIRAMKSNLYFKIAINKKKLKKGAVEILIKEFYLLKGMDHPNILRTFEMFQDDNHYYLITE